MRLSSKLITSCLLAGFLSGCMATKVVTAPVKGVYTVGKYGVKGVAGATKMVGKGVYNTGKYGAKGTIGTGKFAMKNVAMTANGIVKTGATVVHVSNAAMTTTTNVLNVTTAFINVHGEVMEITKQIRPTELEATLATARSSAKILRVLVDVAR